MSQQQLTEYQLPINHEALIETESKFKKALAANKSTEETKQIQIIIKIIPSPILERNFQVSRKSDVGIQFPTTMQQKMTVSKTITVTKDIRQIQWQFLLHRSRALYNQHQKRRNHST